jgi:transposase
LRPYRSELNPLPVRLLSPFVAAPKCTPIALSPYTRLQGPSARAVSFALACPAAERSPEAQTYVDRFCQVDPATARAHVLIQAFLTMVRERRGADLEAWRAKAMPTAIDALARSARGLQEALAAVTAGLTLTWNTGATEEQIHRLKLLKH